MSAGQYIRRAAGYFIKLVVLVGLLYLLMFVTGTARVSAEFFFRELFTTPRGILLMAALAELKLEKFPFGAAVRDIYNAVLMEAQRHGHTLTMDLPDQLPDIVADRDAIINAFHAAGYVMAGEVPGESMTFRAGSFLRRLWLTFDDRVTVRTFGGGIVIEGIRKEAVHAQFRINTYIQNRSYGKRD